MGDRCIARHKKTIIVGGVSLLALVAIAFVPSGRIYHRRDEINIQTGQARHSWYVLSLKLSDRIEETPLSLALAGETVNVVDIEPWHFAGRSWPYQRTRITYRFSGALTEAKQFGMIAEMLELSAERKMDIATEILTLWQRTGRVGGSTEYMVSLTKGLERS